MKLQDLPETTKVTACSHVMSGERPVLRISFSNGLDLTCLEPDHGIFGERYSERPTLRAVFEKLPWLMNFEIEAGQHKELADDGTWSLVEGTRGPREMTVAERDAYYAGRNSQ